MSNLEKSGSVRISITSPVADKTVASHQGKWIPSVKQVHLTWWCSVGQRSWCFALRWSRKSDLWSPGRWTRWWWWRRRKPEGRWRWEERWCSCGTRHFDQTADRTVNGAETSCCPDWYLGMASTRKRKKKGEKKNERQYIVLVCSVNVDWRD